MKKVRVWQRCCLNLDGQGRPFWGNIWGDSWKRGRRRELMWMSRRREHAGGDSECKGPGLKSMNNMENGGKWGHVESRFYSGSNRKWILYRTLTKFPLYKNYAAEWQMSGRETAMEWDGGYCHAQTGFLEMEMVRKAAKQNVILDTKVTHMMWGTGCGVSGKKRIKTDA